jgi:hypothetical protein
VTFVVSRLTALDPLLPRTGVCESAVELAADDNGVACDCDYVAHPLPGAGLVARTMAPNGLLQGRRGMAVLFANFPARASGAWPA